MISIDQNCHSLWDVVPKLQALAAAGRAVTHFVEDVDAAFTSLGSPVDSPDLRLAPERFHRSGGADWGAALFYTEFLGRQPVELRDWEPFTGLKTKALAKRLGRSVDDLYDEFSPSGNWQLIGSSFVGDRDHHRVMGDLTIGEVGDFVRELTARARADMDRAFPSAASRKRIAEWFAREDALVERLLAEHAGGRLAGLYEAWLRAHLSARPAAGVVGIDFTSRLFACGPAGPPGRELLEVFLREYDRAAGLYNEAIAESGQKLRPLDVQAGELPLFATLERAGHLTRTGARLAGGEIRIGERAFALAPGGRLPIEALAAGGVRCIAGKAVVLVSQVRLGESGRRLALPYRGSLYMPAAHLLARKLAGEGLLPGKLAPVVRVRLRLLDRLRSLETPVRLPDYLAAAMGKAEVPARELGEAWADLAAEARGRLAGFREAEPRRRWQRESFPSAVAEIDALDARRRKLAQTDPKAPELRDVWMRIRRRQGELLDALVRQVARDVQVAEIDYYDSRGALLPWSVALGGQTFYNQLLAEAEVYEEDSLQAADHGQA